MGFLGFILTIVGLVAFILTMVFVSAIGDTKSDGGDVVLLIFFALVAVVSLFSAGYCIG